MTTTMHDKTLNNSIDSSLNNVHFRNSQVDESNEEAPSIFESNTFENVY